ncbi:LysR family transcriptional regulator [Croceivirga sp. JEA036]|uniref:LysR family transcriptional regulator n=1 Tax=Croceivirga sp. JEA036 TaxID=2721162 RepID=UPI00143A9196|nr:LysR family transcriptional regulator [Croceivirga sp. JEA036]NJB36192.1 LysR family transcriptional regulator [Croceivirga sp. JEA036]
MHFTFHQLQIFVEVVKQSSITKASEVLHLTQPAVSIQLKKLQEQFSIPLTEVVGRKLYVTPFGLEIAQEAQEILDKYDRINQKIDMYHGKLAGNLSVAVVSTGKYVMPYYLSGFVNAHPAIEFRMDVTNKLRVVEDLEQNKVDFALVSVLPEHLELETIPLLKNELFLVGGTQRLQQQKIAKKRIFEDGPLLFREYGSATRNAMETFIKQQDLLVKKKIELTSNEALKQAVIAGLGYSIMPMIGIKNAVETGQISVIPFKGLPITTEWNLVCLKKKKLSPVAEAFIAYIHTEKEAINTTYFDWVN